MLRNSLLQLLKHRRHRGTGKLELICKFLVVTAGLSWRLEMQFHEIRNKLRKNTEIGMEFARIQRNGIHAQDKECAPVRPVES